jgi:hypothetical protein
MNYSGSVSFEFEVERYLDILTNEWVTHDKVNSDERFEYNTLTLKVEGSSRFTSGKTFGRPEDCYPEDGDTEIDSVTLGEEDWNDKLTEDERDSIIEMIVEQVQEKEAARFEGNEDEDDDYEDSVPYSEIYL